MSNATDDSQTPENDAPCETPDAILTEMGDWGLALLAEHERRICDVHGPVVPSRNMGESLVKYVERLRVAVAAERDLAERQWVRAVREQRGRIRAEAALAVTEAGR